MQFSEKWLREWVNPEITTEELEAQLTMAGLEVDGVEPVAGAFTGVVVGQVKSTEPHPDADKLTLCKVDVGEAELLDIVCGAANVRPELKIPVAKVGAVLPGDFKIKKAKLRGQPSMGMLCAEAELGMAESSDGLMELAADAPIGKDFREYLSLDDNSVEVDLTPNRGDCLGIAGLAREVGVLNRAPVTEPEVVPVAPQLDDTFPVTVEAPAGCPRYVGRVIKGVDLSKPTPLWMVEKLRRSGIRSIDAVVDITNYVLLELGQPMHAFDLDTLSGSIIVRNAQTDEKLTLLDGQEVTLDPATLLICDESRPLAMAGVMGGEASGVTSNTKNIFLESAYFDPIKIAGKARSYGLHTDSSHRFERGVDHQLQVKASERATQLILDIVGGEPGPLVEVASSEHLPALAKITLREAKVNSLLGFDVPANDIEEILTRLGMEVSSCGEGVWDVVAPSYRFDIRIEVDLIEEIGRIYGYSHLPKVTPDYRYSRIEVREEEVSVRTVRRCLVDRDYQETITYSFVDPKMQEIVDPKCAPIALANPISADMGVMRTTIWVGLLKAALHNINRQQSRVRLFETGQTFVPGENEQLTQESKLAGLVTGPLAVKSWNSGKDLVDFFDMKGDLEAVIGLTGKSSEFSFRKGEHEALHPGQTAEIVKGGKVIGLIGALHPSLQKDLGFTDSVYLFEITLGELLEGTVPAYQDISKFPETSRDLAFIVPSETAASEIQAEIASIAGDLLADLNLFDVYEGNGIESGKKSLAFGLTLQHPSRTLKDSEVNELIDRVVSSLKQRFMAILRE